MPTMFRLAAFTLALGVLSTPCAAQEADTLTAADGWRSTLTAALAGNQAAFSNWQEGGVDALAATATADGTFDRVVGRVLTSQRVQLAFGVLRQDTLDVRKATDLARYRVRAELRSPCRFSPVASFTARSQFAPGFDYSPDESDYPSLTVVPGEALKVSDALSPLVLTQSAGVAYRPGAGVVVRTGLGLKETVVSIRRLRPVHGNAIDQVARVEAGLDAEVTLERDLMENVRLRSRLFSFQGFGQIGGDAPDVLLENTLTLKVNDLLNVTVDAAAVYDADVSDDVQIREVLAVGVAFDLL